MSTGHYRRLGTKAAAASAASRATWGSTDVYVSAVSEQERLQALAAFDAANPRGGNDVSRPN
ncbi:hypothetical protein [Dactylosporangium sp. CA-139066]|uniref:hypothetical protein n=1 Tax=Dactylosporangium sp. CA-139066 TaxID=3239930 RepID=UPI003D92F501